MRDPGRGFASPVFDSQAAFRCLQDALARPGTVHTIGREGQGAVEGLSVAAAATLLTLADFSTPVWLEGGKNHPAAQWLTFHTGARITEFACEAMFAMIPVGSQTPLLCDFPAGEDCYPDRSATILMDCIDFNSGNPVRLHGPGIRGAIETAPSGLRPIFWQEAAANAARFPLGIDLILTADHQVIGLPRSTRITEVA